MMKSTLTTLLLVASAATATAQMTYTVDRTDDPNSPSAWSCTISPDDCSLRGAVLTANGDGVDSTIVLPHGTYVLTIDGVDQDFSFNGDLDVRDDLVIEAAAGAHPVIQQTVPDRVFDITGSTSSFTMTGPLTVTGGAPADDPFDSGGCIASITRGDVTLTDVRIVGCEAPGQGGGILYSASQSGSSTLDLTRVEIRNCTSGNSGGGLYIANGDDDHAFVRQSVIAGNHVDAPVTSNQNVQGGGIVVFGGLNTQIIDTEVIDNLVTHANGKGVFGGGVATGSPAGVILRRSLVAGNEVRMLGTVGYGGGVYVSGANTSDRTSILLENTTLSGNRITIDTSSRGILFMRGTGLWVGGFADADLRHVTVANTASTLGTRGVETEFNSPTIDITHSIIDGGCQIGAGTTVTSGQFNVERPWDSGSSTTCELTHPSDQIVADTGLRPLRQYGGPTRTHALEPSSPAATTAIGSSACASVLSALEDQRGAVRGFFCEPGAFEVGPDVPPDPLELFSDGFETMLTPWSDQVP
jgi:hypothetical protein